MTNLHSMSTGQMVEMLRVLSQAGLTREDVESLNKQPALATNIVEIIQSNQLIHGRFTTPKQQLAKVREWNQQRMWGFTEADFERLGEPPQMHPSHSADPLHCVVLVPFLETVQQTYRELMKVFADVHNRVLAWIPGFAMDPDHLRLIGGIDHQPGLRWVIADLGSHLNPPTGCRPDDWVKPTMLHAEGLAAACLHPEWVDKMGQKDVPNIWLGGYRLRITVADGWRYAPTISREIMTGELEVNAELATKSLSNYAIPVRRKSRK